MKNYYKILGVKQTATDAEIKQAYRHLAKTLHPDLNRDNPRAADQLANINEAYEVLSDSDRRNQYNKEMASTVMHTSGAGYGGGRGFGAGERQNPQANFFNDNMANQRAQIDNAIKQAYNEGYAKGFNDCKYKAENEHTRNSNLIVELKGKIAELEQEIVYFEKDYEKQSEKLADANAKIQSMEKQQNGNGGENDIEKLKLDLNVALMQNDRAKSKLAGVIDAVEQRDRTIEHLNSTITELNDKIAQLEEYSFERGRDDDISYIVEERAKRIKQIKKQTKDTHYGVLGVLYWADSEEIKSNYNKLLGRLHHKAVAGDEASKKKIEDIDAAYVILLDAKKRSKYNESIDITAEDVEREKELEAEYYNILEKYNADKDEQEFWQYFDEVMSDAQSGDAEAQNELGEIYYDNEYMGQDLTQAVHWFRESAKHQNASGLYNLGLCHYYGDGVDLDKAKGEGFLKMASKLGHKDAGVFLKSTETKK